MTESAQSKSPDFSENHGTAPVTCHRHGQKRPADSQEEGGILSVPYLGGAVQP
jgi:hypothetical protein